MERLSKNDHDGQQRPHTVLAMRDEHLAEDWDAITALVTNGEASAMGLPSGATIFEKKINGNDQHKDQKAFLSDKAMELLCGVLCLEIQYYKRILLKAVNINGTQYAETIAELQQMCPRETADVRPVESCPKLPAFPLAPEPSEPLDDLFVGLGKPRLKCTPIGQQDVRVNGVQLPPCTNLSVSPNSTSTDGGTLSGGGSTGDAISREQSVRLAQQQVNELGLKLAENPKHVKPNRTCMMHVGKAAGSMIGCVLGQTKPTCAQGTPAFDQYRKIHKMHPLALSTERKWYSHMFQTLCPEETDTFLFSARNPLTRMNSWFYFEKLTDDRPRRDLLYKDCYPDSFDTMVVEGLGHNFTGESIPVNIVDMTCPQRALALLAGLRMVDTHNHVSVVRIELLKT